MAAILRNRYEVITAPGWFDLGEFARYMHMLIEA